MLLKKLNIAGAVQNSHFEDVKVPELGKGAEIRIQRMKILGQMRLGELYENIDKMKVKSAQLDNMLRMTASLMCVMVDENGEYLIPEDDVESTMNTLDDSGVFFRLLTANNKVNSVNSEFTEDTLDKAKKNS